jgi:phage terminase Nu1 subunit (DNA packaging protein)
MEDIKPRHSAATEIEIKAQIRSSVRDEFPHISEKHVDAIAELRAQALLSEPLNVKQNLKTVQMGDKDLSLNYKKPILK